MNCPGQGTASGTNADLFFFSLFNQPKYLDMYNNGGTPAHTIPNNSQFKCYDGMHNWNQLQPAPYDGMYQFPSVLGMNPVTGNTDRHKLHDLRQRIPIPTDRVPVRQGRHAAPRQVRGGNGRASGL